MVKRGSKLAKKGLRKGGSTRSMSSDTAGWEGLTVLAEDDQKANAMRKRYSGRQMSGDAKDDETFEEYFDDSETDSDESSVQSLEIQQVTGGTEIEMAYLYLQRQKERMRVATNEADQAEELRFGMYIDEKEYRLLKRELVETKTLKKFLAFDVISGFIVMANAVMLGLTTEELVREGTPFMLIINIVFVVFFSSEVVIRVMVSSKKWKDIAQDGWMILDVVCVSFSLVDLVMELVTSEKSGVALMSVLRLMRLARLIRLVRLVSMFEGLWALVSGLVSGCRPIFWSVTMLVMFCAIFGLLIFELSWYFHSSDTDEQCEGWNNLGDTALSMMRVSTFDGGDLMRAFTTECTHPALLILLLAFVSIASLGILNLVVGVLLTTTLREAKQDDGWQSFTRKLLGHKALRELRRVLNDHCYSLQDVVVSEGSPLLSRMKMLFLLNEQGQEKTVIFDSPREGPTDDMDNKVLEGIEEAEFEANNKETKQGRRSFAGKMQQLIHGQSAKDVEEERNKFMQADSFADYFSLAKVTAHDINEIFDAAKEVWGTEKPITVNDFTSGVIWTQGKVHPLDVAEMMSMLSELHLRIRTQLSNLHGVSWQVEEATQSIAPLLNKGNVRAEDQLVNQQQVEKQAKSAGKQQEASRQLEEDRNDRRRGEMSRREQELMDENIHVRLRAETWAKFDIPFSIIVILNATSLGVELTLKLEVVRNIFAADFGTDDMIWLLVEMVFYMFYIVEAALRVVFDYQMVELKDYRTSFGFLPRRMWGLDFKVLCRIVYHFPKLCKHWSFDFDLAIIAIATVDNLVLRFIDGGEDYTQALRVMGLIRLLRFGRLIHLIKPLRVLATGFVENTKLIFWSLILLIVLTYICAIAMVDLVGQASEDVGIQKHWGTISSSMLSLILMATFNDWGKRIDEVGAEAVWAYPAGIFFVLVAGLGILNLITGVMMQAAFGIVMAQGSLTQASLMNSFKGQFLAVAEDVRVARLAQVAERKIMVQETIEGIFMEGRKNSLAKPITGARVAIRTSAAGAKTEETLGTESVASLKTGSDDAPVRVESRNSLTSAKSIAIEDIVQEDDEEETKEALIVRYKGNNQNNICTVKSVLWISGCEVGIQFHTKEDKTVGPVRNPSLSCLQWEGGRRTVDFFFQKPTVLKDFAGGEGAQNTPGPMGILVFRDVPVGKTLNFRFGGNYPWLVVHPDNSTLLHLMAMTERGDKQSEQYRLLRHKGLTFDIQQGKSPPGTMSGIEVEEALENQALGQLMQKIGLKPEEVLMAFGQLNVLGEPRLRTTHILEAIARLRQAQIGIDVARAKSLMRRLMTDTKEMSGVAEGCEKTFAEICEVLRDVKFQSELEGLEQAEMTKPRPQTKISLSTDTEDGMTPVDTSAGESGAGSPRVPMSSIKTSLSGVSGLNAFGLAATAEKSIGPRPSSALHVGRMNVPEANAMLATKVERLRQHISHRMEKSELKAIDIGRDRKMAENIASMTRGKVEHYEDTASVCSADTDYE